MDQANPPNTASFNIANRPVGPGHPCYVIAEIGQAHDGSLGNAHAYIDLAAKLGADAVKFQTHIAAAESTPAEPWRVKFSPQDETRFDYWKRMEFTESQWGAIAEHCAEAGIEFLSSAFSAEAVQLLDRLGMAAWKLASGELTNLEMVDQMLATGRPLLTSSGMSPVAEIDQLVARASAAGTPIAVFQCTSAYPCPPEELGLNVIGEFSRRWPVPVGLSDHSGTIYPGLAAVVLGASLLEVHLTFSHDVFGPDVASSLAPEQFSDLVEGIRLLESAMANPVDKDASAEALAPMRALFTKSLVAARDLPKGTVLSEADLLSRKPGSGIPASALPDIVGRTLTRPLAMFDLLSDADLA